MSFLAPVFIHIIILSHHYHRLCFFCYVPYGRSIFNWQLLLFYKNFNNQNLFHFQVCILWKIFSVTYFFLFKMLLPNLTIVCIKLELYTIHHDIVNIVVTNCHLQTLISQIIFYVLNINIRMVPIIYFCFTLKNTFYLLYNSVFLWKTSKTNAAHQSKIICLKS